MPFLSGYANVAKPFYSLLPIVLAVTSSASSEDTPSTHRYKAKSAEFPPKCFRITSWIYFVVAWQLWRQDVVMSFRICLFFFCDALLRCWWTVPLKWILRETVSTNLLLRKPEYRTNSVNYRFGIQFTEFILLLSINKLSGISGCQLVYFRYIVSVCPSSSLLLLLRRPQKTSKI